MTGRPNIVFITADQQRADCFGFEGRKVKTPHLDRIAEEGTVFRACITPNPVCQPARASILTGQLPRTHGVADNGLDLPPETGAKGFAGALSAAGYHTALIGKAHFATSHTFEATGTPECRQSMDRFGPDWTGPYMGFDHVEMVVEGHNQWDPMAPPGGQHYERWYYADGHGEEKNRLHRENGGPDTRGAPQTWHSSLPPAWHNSSWVGDRTVAHMAERVRADPDTPFCVWASFPDPHHPFDAPLPWSLLHDPAEVDLPPHRTLDLDRRPWWHRASLEGEPQIRDDLAKIRKDYSRIGELSDAHLREIIANTYGMLSLIDHNVGRIFAELHRLGIADNTLVIYASDHGDWLGDHGLLLKGPIPYEGLIRVACLVWGLDTPAGKRVDEPVSTLDVPATLLDYAGAEPLHAMHSQSLRPLIETDTASRDFALNEWKLHPSRTGIELDLACVRTETAKLIVDRASGVGEMYDLAEDPDEMVNVADDPAYAALRRELEEMIATRPDDRVELVEPVGMA